MQNKNIVISVIVCVAIAGISFWGGMKYGASKSVIASATSRNQNGFSQNVGGKGLRGGVAGGNSISGQIISSDANSMTISLRAGGSTIVLYSPITKVEKTVDGTVSDIVAGKQVMVTGTANTDGSFNATSIQIRPNQPVQSKTN